MPQQVCKLCGETFEVKEVSPYNVFCEKCSTLANQRKRTFPKICQSCGKEFEGARNSRYCPECARTRRILSCYRYYHNRANARKIGSIDKCEFCGKEYVVNNGKQRYCPDCTKKAVLSNVRKLYNQKMETNPEVLKQNWKRKNEEAGYRKCIVCGKTFYSEKISETCSPECRKIRDEQQLSRKKVVSEKNKEKYKARSIKKLANIIETLDTPSYLQELRQNAGLSIPELAKKARVNTLDIYRVEAKVCKMGELPAAAFMAIADALEMEPHQLLAGEETEQSAEK